MNKIVFWIALYPIIAHIGLKIDNPNLAVVYLIVLVLLSLLYSTLSPVKKNISIISLVLLVFLMLLFDAGYLLIRLPPVIILLLLISVFARSLFIGNTPLITQFARQVEDDKLSIEKIKYTKKITQLWLAVFAFMLVQNIILSLYFSLEAWSFFTHIGNYLLVTMVMIIEFIYRRKRFDERIDFIQFIKKIITYKWSSL